MLTGEIGWYPNAEEGLHAPDPKEAGLTRNIQLVSP